MATPHRWFGAGSSIAPDSAKAGAEAAAAAIGGRTPALVLVFCSGRHDLAALLLAVRAEAGDGVPIVGSSTMGELANEGASVGGVAVAALGGDGFAVRTKTAHLPDAGEVRAGAVAAEAMTDLHRPHSVLMVFGDGASPTRYEVVRGAYSVLGAAVPLVGGFAGHDRESARTFQFHDSGSDLELLEDAVIGVALGSDGPIGIGVGHGWHRIEPPMVVTRSCAGRVHELDGEPALDVLLRRYGMAGRSAAELFAGLPTPPALGLSRHSGEDVRQIRSGDDDDRSVRATGEVPQGSVCWFMGRDDASLLAAVADSCADALDGLGGKPPLGVLAFDCGGRRALLGADGMTAETEALQGALGRTPFAGFYADGQIARVHGALGTHDLTLVTLALG